MEEFKPYNPYLNSNSGDDFEFKGWEQIFDETFLSYYQLLLKRSSRLTEINKISIDYLTYTDMCLVMIRALLIESEKLKENYTLQNFLEKHSKPELVTVVNEFINQPINKMMTLRDALKITVDKFIAHNDTIVCININREKEMHTDLWFKREIFMSDIMWDDYPFTIEQIIAFIKGIITQVELPTDLTGNSIAYKEI